MLGELLVEQRIISSEQLNEALEKQIEYALPLGETLIEMELVTENDLLKALGRHLSVEYLNIAESDYQVIDRSLAALIPEDMCRRLMIVPIFLVDDGVRKQLTVAMSDPLNLDAIEEVEQETETNVLPVLTTSSAVTGGIHRLSEQPAELRRPPAPGKLPVLHLRL